jgi:hypothetical protein
VPFGTWREKDMARESAGNEKGRRFAPPVFSCFVDSPVLFSPRLRSRSGAEKPQNDGSQKQKRSYANHSFQFQRETHFAFPALVNRTFIVADQAARASPFRREAVTRPPWMRLSLSGSRAYSGKNHRPATACKGHDAAKKPYRSPHGPSS